MNPHQTDTIQHTIAINNLENRVDRLKEAALKTLNNALNRLQENQQKLAQANADIAQKLQQERKIRFYANCASFALAFVPVAGAALASGVRLFSDGVAAARENGTEEINKQSIQQTLTYIRDNAEQFPAIAEDTTKFLAGEVPAEYALYATGVKVGQKAIEALSQTAIDKLSEKLEKKLKLTASEVQGNTVAPIDFDASSSTGSSSTHAAPSSPNTQTAQTVDAEDSGLDTDDEDNNRLAGLIKRNRGTKFSRALAKASIDDINRPITRTRRRHIESTLLDIAAHYGRAEMADELEENGATSLRHGSALKAVDVAYSNAEG